jgi:hypothetical protein
MAPQKLPVSPFSSRKARGFPGGGFVAADSQVRRKTGHSSVGELLVPKCDRTADRRRIPTLSVRETGTDGELRAIGQLNQKRAEPPFVAAGPLLMTDHSGFRVLERFHLEQDEEKRGILLILPGIWVKWEVRSGSCSPVILDSHHAAHVASACRR